MPQPLPQKSKITHGGGWPLERRAELAVCIAWIATIWSRIEERLRHIAFQLLGAPPRLAASTFGALSATADKFRILRTLAIERLDKESQGRLDELLDRYMSVKLKRDCVVRGHWYVSDDHPSALVWADPAEELACSSDFWLGFRAAEEFVDQLTFARNYARPRPAYMLFEKLDFQEIIDEMRLLGFALTDFLVEITERTSEPA